MRIPVGVEDLECETLWDVSAVDGEIETTCVVGAALGYCLICVVPGVSQANCNAREGDASIVDSLSHHVLSRALVVMPDPVQDKTMASGEVGSTHLGQLTTRKEFRRQQSAGVGEIDTDRQSRMGSHQVHFVTLTQIDRKERPSIPQQCASPVPQQPALVNGLSVLLIQRPAARATSGIILRQTKRIRQSQKSPPRASLVSAVAK